MRPVRRWPWGEETAARRLLELLAHLHATATPAEAREVLSDWDYESELAERTRSAAEALERLPREEDLAPLRRGLGSLRRIGEALPEVRRQLLAFTPLGTAAIHGDAHSGNALVRSGERPVLLDWGRTRLGSPLEDVSSWLQSLGYWEPVAKRRHDTLLAGYLAARGLPARADRELRDAYWLAGLQTRSPGPCSSTSGPRAMPREMPTEERKRRMARLQRNVLAEDVHSWVDSFLEHARTIERTAVRQAAESGG